MRLRPKPLVTSFSLRSYLLTLISFQGREKKANKFANSTISMEELERMQQEAFNDAAKRHS